MSGGWKPGDVAIRRSGPQITRPYEQIAVAVEKCFNEAHDGTLHWHHASGGWDPLNAGEFGPTYRRVVVIDPEDSGQVERLCELVWAQPFNVEDADAFQAALRELANPKPPKLPAPTGLGAVVVDTEGEAWVHFGNDCWIKQVPNANLHTKSYADIDFLELASDGAEPLANWERALLRGQS